MKILFVCRSNIARSQMAEAIYNHLTKSNDADSAGTEVKHSDETILNRMKRVGDSHAYKALSEIGLDISNKRQSQITRSMLGNYDLIVSMADDTHSPQWLVEAPNYVHWDVPDPRDQGLEVSRNTRSLIEDNVRNLIKSEQV